jgi:hypothetical protein
MHKITKPFWFLLAALFLIEAWLWDHLRDLGRRIAALIPFEAFKQALIRGLNSLPAPVVLLVFLIPVAVVEPMKLVALWLMTHHHVFLGLVGFLTIKIVGLGIIAFLFDVTRDKLLSMAWFARVYDFVLRIRDWAHALVAPYKQRLRAAILPYRERALAVLRNMQRNGSFGRKFSFLRARIRRANRSA